MYEASGLRFDHLWVLGLHSDNWPPPAQPNPFIPGSLQQQAQLPHSSPQRELEVARTVTQRLLETADDIVFSYPGMIDGEATLSSPLLDKAGIKAVESLPCWQAPGWQSMIAQSGEPVTEPLSMPGSLTGATARGGSSILKNQALCPFRAFARNRLGAESLETPVDGISAMLHGSLVHRVLENFWRETGDQQALLVLNEEQLLARIRSHVDHVLDEERGLMFRPAFRDVEANRLCRQVGEQLELEKTREPFEVAAFEKEIVAEIEGLPIRLIIDRVDRLPDGGQAIIDYKTGRVDPKKWFGERPEDPQLPLYAISAETTPAAVVFSVVRDDGCLYKGVVRYDGIFPNLPPKMTKTSEYLVEAGANLPQTILNWRQVLHRLMADFLAGEATIDPKDGNSTCKNSFCELQPLCRIGELAQLEKTGSTTSLQEPVT
jgi:probable DNA repair protein